MYEYENISFNAKLLFLLKFYLFFNIIIILFRWNNDYVGSPLSTLMSILYLTSPLKSVPIGYASCDYVDISNAVIGCEVI